jgi:hypothetical protein
LISEINRLQRELDRANESIDDKLDKLEDVGMGVVGLTEKLEDARAKIVALEDEIARLSRKEDRRTRRLTRIRCQKCHVKVDVKSLTQADERSVSVCVDPMHIFTQLCRSSMEISKDHLPTEPPTPPTRTSEALKANLQSVNHHLDELKEQWKKEKQRLLDEKNTLENAANRLNSQVKTSKEEARNAIENNRVGEKLRVNVVNVGGHVLLFDKLTPLMVVQELDMAKRTISVLESELSSERSRLRVLITEQERMQREKKQILIDLQRTESVGPFFPWLKIRMLKMFQDMDDVKQQLQRLKKENHEIEKELRGLL